MRSFAFGRLGWTTDRWRRATFDELNNAIEGYWINWEWQTAWLAREINFEAICETPNYKSSSKPRTKHAYMPLSIDKKEDKKLSNDEIKKAEDRL